MSFQVFSRLLTNTKPTLTSNTDDVCHPARLGRGASRARDNGQALVQSFQFKFSNLEGRCA